MPKLIIETNFERGMKAWQVTQCKDTLCKTLSKYCVCLVEILNVHISYDGGSYEIEYFVNTADHNSNTVKEKNLYPTLKEAFEYIETLENTK